MNDALDWILSLVSSVDPVLRTLIAGLGMLLETSMLVGLVVPGDSIVIVASTAVEGVGQYLGLVVAVIVGALCGESIGFALGRYFGPKIRRSRLGARIGERQWTRAENYLDRRGGIAVFISRFLPVLHSLVPLTVGMSTMRYSRFMAWTVPACVIWAVTYVSVGAAAAGTYRELSTELHGAGYIFVAIIAAFLVLAVIGKRYILRREAPLMAAPGDGNVDTIDPDPHPSGPNPTGPNPTGPNPTGPNHPGPNPTDSGPSRQF